MQQSRTTEGGERGCRTPQKHYRSQTLSCSPVSCCSSPPLGLLSETRLVDDGHTGVGTADAHVCRQQCPHICLGVVHFHRGQVGGAVIAPHHVEEAVEGHHAYAGKHTRTRNKENENGVLSIFPCSLYSSIHSIICLHHSTCKHFH